MGISRWLLFLFLFPFSVNAQVNRYFVHFKDKANSAYSIGAPLQFLSQKSINRRGKENFPLSPEDFPVNATYLNQVKATGASVFYSSRWLNGVLIQTTPDTASAVAGLPFVISVELVAPGTRLNARRQTKQKWEKTSQLSSASYPQQLQMIGVDQMQQQGYQGEGIDVAVLDGGFTGVNTLAAFQKIYTDSRLKEVFNFVKNTTDVYSDNSHGEEVLSVMAGTISGSYLGGADKANYYLYETEDVTSEYRVEEYNWLFAAERADSIGVDVISSSLGYSTFDDPSMNYTLADLNGRTSVISRAAHAAAVRGILVVNAAGNWYDNTWPNILFPADAAGILACASVDGNGLWSNFSLVGPTADGRIKPDVAAMGSGTSVINSSGVLVGQYGTSFSTPLIASLVIGLRQALPNATAQEIYSRVINSASLAETPNNQLGYGIPNFLKAMALTSFADALQVYPNPTSREIKIVFKNPNNSRFNFSLYDANGKMILEQSDTLTWQNNPYSVDLSLVAAGVYFARISMASYTRTVRIVRIN
ncbi:MAG: S8 family peptidase [Bacteroidetes bacterium]|nr:S8 family peptidase [Bacteroidota bacterium]